MNNYLLMNKKFQAQLIKQLYELAPSVPFISTGKSRSDLINKLFQLAPEKPLIGISGIELVQNLSIPSSPNQKKWNRKTQF